ncbi:MAG: hypothetical protein LC803_10945 [Acidobacteria bacterium]|nr:hypothetical protein [Acidobacteriota bacterium]
MDATILGAIAGIVGGVIGAVVGGVFALKAAKQQIKVMAAQSQGSVNERLYNQNFELMRFLAEHPKLRPYFYENKELSEAETAEEKLQVLSAAEMIAGFLELVALQMSEIPEGIQLRWQNYIIDEYNSSSVLREHFNTYGDWYAEEFLRLLPPNKDARSLSSSPLGNDASNRNGIH